MKRMTREELWLDLATSLARRSTCDRAAVGAVLVGNNHIIGVGYNGSPRGTPHCSDVGCLESPEDGRCKRTIHAEANAVAHKTVDSSLYFSVDLYVTHKPCIDCLKLAISTGVGRIYYIWDYKDEERDFFLKENPHVITFYQYQKTAARLVKE